MCALHVRTDIFYFIRFSFIFSCFLLLVGLFILRKNLFSRFYWHFLTSFFFFFRILRWIKHSTLHSAQWKSMFHRPYEQHHSVRSLSVKSQYCETLIFHLFLYFLCFLFFVFFYPIFMSSFVTRNLTFLRHFFDHFSLHFIFHLFLFHSYYSYSYSFYLPFYFYIFYHQLSLKIGLF